MNDSSEFPGGIQKVGKSITYETTNPKGWGDFKDDYKWNLPILIPGTSSFNTSVSNVMFFITIKTKPYLYAKPQVIKTNVQPNTNSIIHAIHGSIISRQ